MCALARNDNWAERVVNRSRNWDLLGGEGLSRGNFLRGNLPMGKVPLGEKVGSLSPCVEKIYVNRFAYFGVWKSPVEKPVDNVEKYGFSTVIHRVWTDWDLAFSVHTGMHNFGYLRGFLGYVAVGNEGDFSQFSGEKLAIYPKGAYFAWGFSGYGVKFCTTCTKWGFV